MTEQRVTDEMYKEHKDLVIDVARRWIKKLPDEDLDDLTQTCWERLVREYPNYNPELSELVVWIQGMSRNALISMVQKFNAEKRRSQKDKISIDELCDGKEKYL